MNWPYFPGHSCLSVSRLLILFSARDCGCRWCANSGWKLFWELFDYSRHYCIWHTIGVLVDLIKCCNISSIVSCESCMYILVQSVWSTHRSRRAKTSLVSYCWIISLNTRLTTVTIDGLCVGVALICQDSAILCVEKLLPRAMQSFNSTLTLEFSPSSDFLMILSWRLWHMTSWFFSAILWRIQFLLVM